MGNGGSGLRNTTTDTVLEGGREGVQAARRACRAPVDPDMELVDTVITGLDPVNDTGARKRVREGLADFRRMYLGTFVAESKVSVFELYDCMQAVSDAFLKLQYDCDWGADSRRTVAWARNLAITRMQACMDECTRRTGMVDPRPFASDAAAHTRYMELVRAWPANADSRVGGPTGGQT